MSIEMIAHAIAPAGETVMSPYRPLALVAAIALLGGCATIPQPLQGSYANVSTAAAQQASGLVTLPLIMIAYAQSTGSIYGSIWPGVFVGAIAWVLAIVGLWRGMKAVNRGRLMGVADGI